jgi:hypothetical protein
MGSFFNVKPIENSYRTKNKGMPYLATKHSDYYTQHIYTLQNYTQYDYTKQNFAEHNYTEQKCTKHDIVLHFNAQQSA